MERTHLQRRDLDWLPPSFKAIRWAVAGASWTGLAGGVIAVAVFTPIKLYLIGKPLAAVAAGGLVAGDRAARAVLRSRLRKLASGAVDLSRLPAEPDGELIHVTGVVRALERTVPSLLGSGRGVYRRVGFAFDDKRVVHESAVDFWLVSPGVEPVLVEVDGARLAADEGRWTKHDASSAVTAALEALPLPDALAATMARRAKRRGKGKKLVPTRAGEILLQDGDRIEVLGYKSRTIDGSVSSRLERDTPYRATLRSGKLLPLLIAPAP